MGGSCLPKDTAALVRMAELAGFDFGLVRAAVQANDEHRARLVERVVSLAGGSLNGRTIALWGLTFKANTDDLRRSPAIAIGQDLAVVGARVRVYDPMVRGRSTTSPSVPVRSKPAAAPTCS